MTLGEKIRKYRILKGLTQKELGMKVGFSAATADSRIRKYEKDIMAPKEDIRSKIAEALDVDYSALSDISIESYEDIMHVLFLFEEMFGMEMERNEEKTTFSFDNNNPNYAKLLSYMYSWYVQKKSILPETDEARATSLETYQKWKARFPKDIQSYWKEQSNAINTLFDPLVSNLASSQAKIVKLSELINRIREMIQSGITIETGSKLYGAGDAALVLSFSTTELLHPVSQKVQDAFAGFLYDVRTMEEYGMPLYTEMNTNEKGTQISYILRFSPLASFRTTILQIQEFEKNRGQNNDYDEKIFESQYEDTLETYEVDLKEEILRYSN